jgi:hypothetical protein
MKLSNVRGVKTSRYWSVIHDFGFARRDIGTFNPVQFVMRAGAELVLDRGEPMPELGFHGEKRAAVSRLGRCRAGFSPGWRKRALLSKY